MMSAPRSHRYICLPWRKIVAHRQQARPRSLPTVWPTPAQAQPPSARACQGCAAAAGEVPPRRGQSLAVPPRRPRRPGSGSSGAAAGPAAGAGGGAGGAHLPTGPRGAAVAGWRRGDRPLQASAGGRGRPRPTLQRGRLARRPRGGPGTRASPKRTPAHGERRLRGGVLPAAGVPGARPPARGRWRQWLRRRRGRPQRR